MSVSKWYLKPEQNERRQTMAKSKKLRPALDPESREQQMIAYATDLSEQQLLDGTASSQVIAHYLKLGSTRARLENEKLRKANKLI